MPSSIRTGADVRSLPPAMWPAADRQAWILAQRPNERLVRGGAGSHLKAITLKDLERRYGYFLHHLQRRDTLDASGAAGVLVTQQNIQSYLEELRCRVSSVTPLSFHLQASTRNGVTRSSPGYGVAHGDREGPCAGDPASVQGRAPCFDKHPARGGSDPDHQGRESRDVAALVQGEGRTEWADDRNAGPSSDPLEELLRSGDWTKFPVKRRDMVDCLAGF